MNVKAIRRNEFYHSLPHKKPHPLNSAFTTTTKKITSEKRKEVVCYVGLLRIRLD